MRTLWKMSSGLLAALLPALLLGCASTATQQQGTAEQTTRIQANLRIAERLTETASQQSLTQLSGLVTTEELKGQAGVAELGAFAGRLWKSLYPELPSPFPSVLTSDTGSLAESAPADSKFFQAIGPALSLLAPGPVPDDAAAANMLSGITTADGINSDSVLPPYLHALLLARQQSQEDAIRPWYEECLRRDSTFYPAKLGVIDAAIDQGTAATEMPVLTKYAGELPTPSADQTATARILLAAGQPQQAADAAAQALLTAPDSTDLLIIRAKAFEAMGNWYQALSILDALLNIAPGNGDALSMKATILFEKAGDPDGAMKVLSDAEGKFPGDPSFPELRGRIMLARGNIVGGEAALQDALKIDPRRVSTLALLARTSAGAGRWQQADGYLQRIPERDRNAELLQLGWRIAMGLEGYDRALSFADSLEKTGVGDSGLLFRVRTLVAARRTQDAKEQATSDLKNATTPAVRATLYVLRAQAERQAGDDETTTLADLRSALLENPDDRSALLAVADVLSSAREYRRALGYLKHALELAPEDADIKARISTAARLGGLEH